jgi:XTP/dITP diphosphohydrolase
VRIALATANPGKLRELRAILSDIPAEWVAVAPGVEEDGQTYHENAARKACAVARATGGWALGEDSGIEVDALGGRPGVWSARFAGPHATDEERNRKLLELLRGVPAQQRTARYRAAVVLAAPDGSVRTHAEGVCEGRIAEAPRGTGGFGYDPVFWLPERGVTMAELPPEEKNRISHRARALDALRPALLSVCAAGA